MPESSYQESSRRLPNVVSQDCVVLTNRNISPQSHRLFPSESAWSDLPNLSLEQLSTVVLVIAESRFGAEITMRVSMGEVSPALGYRRNVFSPYCDLSHSVNSQCISPGKNMERQVCKVFLQRALYSTATVPSLLSISLAFSRVITGYAKTPSFEQHKPKRREVVILQSKKPSRRRHAWFRKSMSGRTANQNQSWMV